MNAVSTPRIEERPIVGSIAVYRPGGHGGADNLALDTMRITNTVAHVPG